MASLANRYRPQSFDDVVGQTTVVNIVKAMCESESLSNRNFLFTGPAGIGKTTLSRIIAKSLNGNTDNIIEVDAASHSGVDDIRELIQEAAQYPVGTKYKIVICDECFPSNTWITTPSGQVQIKDINVGDHVNNLTGQSTVTNVFKNRVAISNLISIIVGNKQIITTKDHLFFTDYGWVPACKLISGDYLYGYKELCSMRENFSGQSSQQQENFMQSSVSSDLVAQQNVRETYKWISKNMSDMWQRLLYSEEYKCNNLFRKVWVYLEETESKFGEIIGATFKALAYIYMSCVWNTEGDYEQSSSEILQYEMCGNLGETTSETEETCNQAVRMVQAFIYRTLWGSEQKNMFSGMSGSTDCRQISWETFSRDFITNEAEQSNVKSSQHLQNACNQRDEWDIARCACIAWWERAVYNTPDIVIPGIRSGVDIRISCTDKNNTEQQSEPISYELQTRPSLCGQVSGCRGGWEDPQHEIPTVVRRKKGEMSKRFRVDSIEVYQRGYNDKLFRSSFSDTELSQDYVIMYDLEVDGHPSYFANDVLVHNCHALSNTAWQALLKCLEEQVGNTVWILCTTNPEKIPNTILSRVQTFKLSKLSTKVIQDRLKHILDSEIAEGRQITYTDNALSYLARLAQGGMRDAITSLDKCLAFDTHITDEVVIKALDLPSYDDYFNLLNALVRKDNADITAIVDKVYNSGTNFVKWFEGFHSFLCNIVKFIFLKDISRTMIPYHYLDKLEKYGDNHAFICLKLANVVMNMNKELKITQYQMETAMTYLCTPVAPKKGGGQ